MTNMDERIAVIEDNVRRIGEHLNLPMPTHAEAMEWGAKFEALAHVQTECSVCGQKFGAGQIVRLGAAGAEHASCPARDAQATNPTAPEASAAPVPTPSELAEALHRAYNGTYPETEVARWWQAMQSGNRQWWLAEADAALALFAPLVAERDALRLRVAELTKDRDGCADDARSLGERLERVVQGKASAPVGVTEAIRKLVEAVGKRGAGDGLYSMWRNADRDLAALSTGTAILMPREERDALIQRAIDAEDKLASHITRAAKFVQYPDPEPASAVEAAERHLGSCQAQLAIAHSERDAARRELAEAVSVLDELASAASEQQFTLNSKGWNVGEGRPWSKDPDWSKAGAQRHQYDRIEAVLARVTPIVEGHPAAQRPGGADVERALLVKLYAWAANETDGGRIDLRDAAREAIFARPAPPSHAEARDDVPRAGMLAEDGTLPMVPSGWTPELVRKFNERGRSLATPEPRAAESAISDFELGRLVVGEYQLADNRGVGGKAALAEAGKKARALLSRDARPASIVWPDTSAWFPDEKLTQDSDKWWRKGWRECEKAMKRLNVGATEARK